MAKKKTAKKNGVLGFVQWINSEKGAKALEEAEENYQRTIKQLREDYEIRLHDLDEYYCRRQAA